MIASLLLVMGVLATLTLMDGANGRITENRAREAATNLAREIAEAARAVPYTDLTPTTIQTSLQSQPGLADASGAAGWNLVRRGTTFVVTVDTCIIDDADPRDGLGDHTGLGKFCPDASATGTTDLNPDDYRRVTIQVDRVRVGKSISARQSAVINNPGSAFAPSVRSLVPTTPAGLTTPYRITNSAVTSVTFTTRVTPRATYVNWLVDNIKQTTGAVRGVADDWTFTWPIPSTLSDGVYLIGAQGFSANNQTGTSKAVTVTLNRFRPARPTNLAGGRNGGMFEFEWSPAPDRDILGYRVYRVTGNAPSPPATSPSSPTADLVMCSVVVTSATPHSCRALDVAGPHSFYVVAYAPACCGAATTLREESLRPLSADTLKVTSNQEPNPVRNLSAIRSSSNGAPVVTLNWDPPQNPPAGESSDTLRYYRIYRDGVAYADRYATTPATQLTFTDTNPGTTLRRYWVVSVDSGLAESTKLEVGPV